MDRLKRSDKGFTLIELVIAIALSAVVLLSASNLLINFGRFSSKVVQSEASLMGTALGAFEGITNTLTNAKDGTVIPAANYAAPSIDIVLYAAGSTAPASSVVYHTYWKSGSNLYYKTGATAPSGAGTLVAKDITTLSFTKDATDSNKIVVVLEAQTTRGATSGVTKEHLETTVVMRGRSAA